MIFLAQRICIIWALQAPLLMFNGKVTLNLNVIIIVPLPALSVLAPRE